MTPLTVLVLCIQACLIQTVVSQQCGCCCGLSGYRSTPIIIGYRCGARSCGASSCGASSCGASSCGDYYGGQGTGEVNVAGNINACGETCVTGAVPVQGCISFDDCVPACGTISICGQCGFEC